DRACHDDVGSQADQLLRERSYPIDVSAGPTKVHPHVAAIGPTQVRKRLSERRDHSRRRAIVFVAPHDHADVPHAVALLRARQERPRRRAAEERDELAPDHSITRSAMASRPGGNVRSSALAVERLITNSNLAAGQANPQAWRP